MFLLNGSPLPLDTPFKDSNGNKYPANWLRFTTLEEKQAIGITEVPDPEIYDDRFYWGVGNPKDLDQCKAMVINQIKTIAASLLAPTDWKIVRFAETGQSVGSEITNYRAAVRAASNTNEAAVNAAKTVDELSILQAKWPEIL